MIKLPKSDKTFQVYFFTSRANRPYQMFVHPWVVTVHKGVIHRWEIINRKYENKDRSGFVYKNFYVNPTQGIKKSPSSKEYWDSKLIGFTVGQEGSLAETMIKFIQTQAFNYQYKEKYTLYPGPNSNTFVQWIINQFPESNIKLPWNAIGKNYK
jgi:hypothetical protein